MANVTTYTVEQLNGLSSTDLRKAGSELGIKNSSKYAKSELLSLCKEVVEGKLKSSTKVDEAKKVVKTSKETVTKKAIVKEKKVPKEKMQRASRIEYVKVTAAVQKIIDGTMRPSEKMKAMFKAGVPIAQITKTLETHYSFVRGTIQRAAKSDLFDAFSEAYESLGENIKAKELNKLCKAAIVANTEQYGDKFAPTIQDLEELVDKMASKIEDEEILNAYVGQLDNADWM